MSKISKALAELGEEWMVEAPEDITFEDIDSTGTADPAVLGFLALPIPAAWVMAVQQYGKALSGSDDRHLFKSVGRDMSLSLANDMAPKVKNALTFTRASRGEDEHYQWQVGVAPGEAMGKATLKAKCRVLTDEQLAVQRANVSKAQAARKATTTTTTAPAPEVVTPAA